MKNTNYRGNMPQLELSLYKSETMKFTVQRNELLSALNICGRCIGKSVMPILDSYRFQITGNKCLITGSSMEVFISKEIDIDSDIQSLDVCVPAKKLWDFIKTLANQSLLFTVKSKEVNRKEAFTMEMKYSTGKFNMPLENGEDFPVLPVIENEPITVPNQDLINGFFKTTFALDESSNKITSNLSIEFGNGIQITGTNGFVFGRAKVFDNTVNLQSLLITKTAPDILVSLGIDGDTQLSYSDRNICFKLSDGTSVYSQLFDGKYPEMKGFLAIKTDKTVMVNLNDLNSALKRMVLFSDIINKTVKLTLSDEGITLEADNEYSESAKEVVTALYSGEKITICLLSERLQSILSKVKSNEVYISCSDEKSPVVIKEENIDSMDNVFVAVPTTFSQH